MTTVENFALGPYAQAKAAYPEIDREVLKTLSEIVGIPPEVLVYWQLDPAIGGATVFLTRSYRGCRLASTRSWRARRLDPETKLAEMVAGFEPALVHRDHYHAYRQCLRHNPLRPKKLSERHPLGVAG